MHKHPQQVKQQEANYKETQQIPFIGYSINYYTALIRHAVYYVNDIKLLHEIANRLLDSLDNETRERILNELSFLTRNEKHIDEATLQMLLNELAKLLSPLVAALNLKKRGIGIKSVVELLPTLDIVMLMYSDDSDVVEYITKLEEVVLKIVETLELYVKYDSLSRFSYYSSIKDALDTLNYEIKVTEVTESNSTAEKIAKVVKKFFRIRIGKRYVAYWGALLSARIKRSGISYISDFDTILKLLPHDEYYVTLMPMLLHYGVSDPSELPKSLKNEIAKYVNYWLAE